MAKGVSLIGRADPTITKMAYAAALGNVPVDNSAALTTMRNTYKSMLDKSGEIFKQIETDKIAMDQDIQSMISPLLDELEDGTLTDPAFENTKTQIQAFSKEAEDILKSKEYKRGDKSAMIDFNRRFNTYVNGVKAEKQQLQNLATNLEGQAYNVTATKGQEFQKGILKFYRGDTDSGVTRTFENNKAYYSMNIGGVTVKKSLEDIADGIIPKDVKTRSDFDTNLQSVGRSAAQGKDFDAIGAKKTAETLLESSPDKIKTLQDFFHTEHRGQTGTLAQGLSSGQDGFGKISAQLVTVLNKNGLLQEYDTEKTPGKITKEDFEGKNAAKYMQLVDDITSGKNYDLSKKIASELYSDVVAQAEHERLKFRGNNDDETLNIPKGGLRLGPMINGQYQQRETQVQVLDYINRLKNGQEIQYQGNEFTFREGKWVQNYGIEGAEQKTIGSADDMRKDVFQTTFGGFLNITTEPKIDHSSGKIVVEELAKNPFNVEKIPDDFISAVGRDDLDVEEYLNKMKQSNPQIKGLEIVARGFGTDDITLELNGVRKTFITDPNFVSDTARATEIWNFLKEAFNVGVSGKTNNINTSNY